MKRASKSGAAKRPRKAGAVKRPRTASPEASVVFRRRVEQADGQTVIEEREARCASAELRDVLGAPWERGLRAPQAERPRAGESVLAELRTLRMSVTEERAAGRRKWILAVEPAQGTGTPLAQAEDEGRSPVVLSGRVQAQVRGDAAEPCEPVRVEGRHALLVHNQGVSVVNQDNVYAIVEVRLNVVIHANRAE